MNDNFCVPDSRSSSVVTEIAKALHEVTETSRIVVVAMEEVSAMTEDLTMAASEQEMNTDSDKPGNYEHKRYDIADSSGNCAAISRGSQDAWRYGKYYESRQSKPGKFSADYRHN